MIYFIQNNMECVMQQDIGFFFLFLAHTLYLFWGFFLNFWWVEYCLEDVPIAL